MVDIVVKGRHMEVQPDIRDYAEQKVGKAAKFLNGMAMAIEVELYPERSRSIGQQQVAEFTITTKGHILRAREASTDMKAAIDMAAAKLESQARRFKDKVVDRHTRGAAQPVAAADVERLDLGVVEEEVLGGVVKIKPVPVKPMNDEEAILQLELLGHDFFVFVAEDTSEINVIYRRLDGDYGILQPRRA